MDAEGQLIHKIARAIPSASGALAKKFGRNGPELRVGIGDDAAVLVPSKHADSILTCDAFVEGVHFLGDVHPPDSIGYKSLARAASDVVAMGGVPRTFLLTIALPSHRTGRWLDEFLGGMRRAARALQVRLAGGDTTRSSKVFISIAVVGEVPSGRAVLRSGARPGDIIYVTGRLGRAQAGLELLRMRIVAGTRVKSWQRPLLAAHLYPKLRLELGAWLARRRVASSMIDISDGLSTDMAHICSASGVGAQLRAESIPCVEIPAAAPTRLGRTRPDPLQMALGGGEDYELLFTVAPRRAALLRRAPGQVRLTAIGEITRREEILLLHPGGRGYRLAATGWDPFRKK